jgi:Entner-Doudoroff aldolase
MDTVLERLGEVGIVPVVKLQDASAAIGLGRALLKGNLPVAEITYRTAAAEESIRVLTKELPELLVGAGTVLTKEQVDSAVAAGAKFIVAPGFSARVVDYCIAKKVPVVPGVSSATEIGMGVEHGLNVLKFFPAEAAGGLGFLKSVAAPFNDVRFIPTGGVDPRNMPDYLMYDKVLAVGGTWIAKESIIESGNFDEVTRLAQEAIVLSLGFSLSHVGINESAPNRALEAAQLMERMFLLQVKDGTSSVFAGSALEFTKSVFLGTHGHIAISTLSIPRAIAFLGRKGISVRPDTQKKKDGRITSVYLDLEVAGFALHLVQR